MQKLHCARVGHSLRLWPLAPPPRIIFSRSVRGDRRRRASPQSASGFSAGWNIPALPGRQRCHSWSAEQLHLDMLDRSKGISPCTRRRRQRHSSPLPEAVRNAFQILRWPFHQPDTLSAAAARGLDQNRIPDPVRFFGRLSGSNEDHQCREQRARRHPSSVVRAASLSPILENHIRAGADEYQPVFFTRRAKSAFSAKNPYPG